MKVNLRDNTVMTKDIVIDMPSSPISSKRSLHNTYYEIEINQLILTYFYCPIPGSVTKHSLHHTLATGTAESHTGHEPLLEKFRTNIKEENE